MASKVSKALVSFTKHWKSIRFAVATCERRLNTVSDVTCENQRGFHRGAFVQQNQKRSPSSFPFPPISPRFFHGRRIDTSRNPYRRLIVPTVVAFPLLVQHARPIVPREIIPCESGACHETAWENATRNRRIIRWKKSWNLFLLFRRFEKQNFPSENSKRESLRRCSLKRVAEKSVKWIENRFTSFAIAKKALAVVRARAANFHGYINWGTTHGISLNSTGVPIFFFFLFVSYRLFHRWPRERLVLPRTVLIIPANFARGIIPATEFKVFVRTRREGEKASGHR